MTSLGPGPEFDLIRRFLAADAERRLSDDVMVGPGDDAAVVSAHPLAISTDLSIEGVHFRRDWLEPEEIGWRAAMAALSDLAAMAARPVGLFLSVATNAEDARGYVERVVAGAVEAGRALDARLLGGDVSRSPGPLILDLVVAGEVTHPLTRDGARAGDEVWVTGRLGAPAMAVRDWLGGGHPAADARERFARPCARTREVRWLRQRVDLTAAIDLSDGIAGDVPHIAAASAVAILLDRDALPLHPAAAATPDLALTGGEEYELCLVCPPGAMEGAVAAFEREFRSPLTRIGSVVEGSGVKIGKGSALEDLPAPEYMHFGG